MVSHYLQIENSKFPTKHGRDIKRAISEIYNRQKWNGDTHPWPPSPKNYSYTNHRLKSLPMEKKRLEVGENYSNHDREVHASHQFPGPLGLQRQWNTVIAISHLILIATTE